VNNSRRRVIIIPVGAILTLITMAAFFLGNTVGPKRKIGAYVHADKLIASDLSESQKQYVYTYFTGELEKVYETNIDSVPYVCAQVKEKDRSWTVIIGESGRYKGDVLKNHIGETFKWYGCFRSKHYTYYLELQPASDFYIQKKSGKSAFTSDDFMMSAEDILKWCDENCPIITYKETFGGNGFHRSIGRVNNIEYATFGISFDLTQKEPSGYTESPFAAITYGGSDRFKNGLIEEGKTYIIYYKIDDYSYVLYGCKETDDLETLYSKDKTDHSSAVSYDETEETDEQVKFVIDSLDEIVKPKDGEKNPYICVADINGDGIKEVYVSYVGSETESFARTEIFEVNEELDGFNKMQTDEFVLSPFFYEKPKREIFRPVKYIKTEEKEYFVFYEEKDPNTVKIKVASLSDGVYKTEEDSPGEMLIYDGELYADEKYICFKNAEGELIDSEEFASLKPDINGVLDEHVSNVTWILCGDDFDAKKDIEKSSHLVSNEEGGASSLEKYLADRFEKNKYELISEDTGDLSDKEEEYYSLMTFVQHYTLEMPIKDYLVVSKYGEESDDPEYEKRMKLDDLKAFYEKYTKKKRTFDENEFSHEEIGVDLKENGYVYAYKAEDAVFGKKVIISQTTDIGDTLRLKTYILDDSQMTSDSFGYEAAKYGTK